MPALKTATTLAFAGSSYPELLRELAEELEAHPKTLLAVNIEGAEEGYTLIATLEG